jgi:methyl-accepting chemotaxis protein
MFGIKDLKIRNKIRLTFILIVVMEFTLFAMVYKGLENGSAIKELSNNMLITLFLCIGVTILLGEILINLINKPIRQLNNIANNIVNGEFNENISIQGNDEIGELSSSLRFMQKDINNLISDSMLVRGCIDKGDFNINLDTSKYKGSWKHIVENNLSMANIFIKNNKVTSDYIKKISKGEISIRYDEDEVGEFNISKKNINTLIENLNVFQKEVSWLKETFKSGNTRDKIDASKFEGVYKEIAECINDTIWISIDVFIKLFEVLKAYSQGDLSVELEKQPGRYGLVNEHLDDLRGNLMNISKEQINIANEIKQGNLSRRIDSSQ